jgi:flagellar motility protein MotE (MotC chaperone)
VTPWATLSPVESPEEEQPKLEDVLPDEPETPSPPVSIKGLTEPPATEQSKAFAQAEINRVNNRQDKHKEVQSIKLNSIRVSDKEEFVQWQEEMRTLDTSSEEELSIDSPPRSHVWLAKAELDAEMEYYEQDDYDDIIEQPVTTYWMKGGR